MGSLPTVSLPVGSLGHRTDTGPVETNNE